jgi:hypothetical protein
MRLKPPDATGDTGRSTLEREVPLGRDADAASLCVDENPFKEVES